MESGGATDATVCNGVKPLAAVDTEDVGLEKREKEEGEEETETESLLTAAVNGGSARKGQKRSRRRVQWNDRNGNKLVEVLEFEPSDSSDSEDEHGDSCFCTIM